MTSSPGLFRENLFRPSGLRIISIVDELHGSAPQMMQTRVRSRSWANERFLAFSIVFVGPRVTNSSPDRLSGAA
jgi:hypothetical protein